MSEKPKRRVWQVHLSTAIALMFMAGGVLWINSIPDIGRNPPGMLKTPIEVGSHSTYIYYGWPYWCIVKEQESRNFYWTWDGAVPNAIVVLAVFVAVAGCFEWLIRRREGRKP